jgi:hypothetical protein
MNFYFKNKSKNKMTAEAIKTLLTMPTETLTTFSTVGEGIASGIVSNGWKIIAVGALIWGGKYLLSALLRLFKSSAH